jgi:hypothetical protein
MQIPHRVKRNRPWEAETFSADKLILLTYETQRLITVFTIVILPAVHTDTIVLRSGLISYLIYASFRHVFFSRRFFDYHFLSTFYLLQGKFDAKNPKHEAIIFIFYFNFCAVHFVLCLWITNKCTDFFSSLLFHSAARYVSSSGSSLEPAELRSDRMQMLIRLCVIRCCVCYVEGWYVPICLVTRTLSSKHEVIMLPRKIGARLPSYTASYRQRRVPLATVLRISEHSDQL